MRAIRADTTALGNDVAEVEMTQDDKMGNGQQTRGAHNAGDVNGADAAQTPLQRAICDQTIRNTPKASPEPALNQTKVGVFYRWRPEQ